MFESELDSHEAFVFAANRALAEIYSERKRLETLKIYKKRISPKELYERLSHKGGEDLAISLEARTFSFTAVGTGTLLLRDGIFEERIEFSGTNVEIKRKVTTGSVFLSFTGNFDYEIYNLALFDTLFGERNEDIPIYSKSVKYELSKIDPLFLALTSSVTDSDGKPIPNLKSYGSSITVPAEYEGEILISYRRLPRKIGVGELDTPIDVSTECEHLLALRCAAYLLLDGNEALAEYYLSLYKSGITALRLSLGRATGEKYLDVLGWA